MIQYNNTFIVFSIIILIWLVVHSIYITIDGLTDEGKHADIAVILGNKVNEDGTISKRLQARLECGLQLYNSGRIKRIIVSGGLGKEGFYEGDKMEQFLVNNGVPSSSIVVDNFGNTTMETVKNTIQLQKSMKFKSIIVVSQYFHVTRTKMLFRKLGMSNISSVSPVYFEMRDIYSLLREFGAYYLR